MTSAYDVKRPTTNQNKKVNAKHQIKQNKKFKTEKIIYILCVQTVYFHEAKIECTQNKKKKELN